jgi:hypothetical protein
LRGLINRGDRGLHISEEHRASEEGSTRAAPHRPSVTSLLDFFRETNGFCTVAAAVCGHW